MERKNLTRWAVYQSDVKYKLWNAKNIYDIIKLTTFAAFVKPPSYIRKKLKSSLPCLQTVNIRDLDQITLTD